MLLLIHVSLKKKQVSIQIFMMHVSQVRRALKEIDGAIGTMRTPFQSIDTLVFHNLGKILSMSVFG